MNHIPDHQLQAFAAGDSAEIPDALAVRIALHVDECPRCATRVAGMDPLATAFAAVHDPLPPRDLSAAILRAADAPEPQPTVEIALGGVLLATALCLFAAFGDPIRSAIDLGVFVNAAGAALGHLGAGARSSATLLPATTLVTLLCLAGAMRLTAPPRRAP